MKYFPIEKITYRTKLNKVEIVSKLSDCIEPEKILFRISQKGTKPYEGKIHNNKFEINRIIKYRNACLPRIYGIIQQNSEGTTIKVNMILHLPVAIFLFIWFGALGCAGVFSLIQFILYSEYRNPAVIFVFGMFVLAYYGIMKAFKYESTKAKRDLEKLFEAEIINEQK